MGRGPESSAGSFPMMRWSNGPTFLVGAAIPVGLAALSFWIASVVSSSRRPPLAPIIFALSIGVGQALYVLPLHMWARHGRAPRFLRGLWLGAGLVLLANLAFWADALIYDR
jgi:hypothetical protein